MSFTGIPSAAFDGVLAVGFGGTNSALALNNNRVMVSSAGAIVESAIAADNILGGATGTLPIAHGGTNSTTALNSNRFAVTSGGKIVEASAVTANRVVIADSNGLPTSAAALTQNRVVIADSNGLPVSASAITASRALVSDSNGVPTQSAITTAQLAATLYWTKYTVSYTDLAAAALTNNIELFSLPAKGVIHKVILRQTTAFAGTLTYTISVGIAGTLTKYIAVYDVTTAVSNTNFGVAATTINETPENFGAAVSIKISAISTVQNLDQASAGVVDAYVLTSLLP